METNTARQSTQRGQELFSQSDLTAAPQLRVVENPRRLEIEFVTEEFAPMIRMTPAEIEPPMITQAKEYIRTHLHEDLSLGQVAQAVNTSMFYFCKMFKKGAGVHFTKYVSDLRINEAKALLLNRHLRVSEIGFQVGFQSLTHFNRVFKKSVGQSPTKYRAQMLHGLGDSRSFSKRQLEPTEKHESRLPMAVPIPVQFEGARLLVYRDEQGVWRCYNSNAVITGGFRLVPLEEI
jgi:AraC-like DNA-binding protein